MFKEIGINEIEDKIKVFSMFNSDWVAISAGDEKKHNAMTASWGGLGILWNMNVATVYVRPSRYTLTFIDRQSHFTVSSFGKGFRKELSLIGSKSGRDSDKINEAGLKTVFLQPNAPAFEQAETVLICRKLYRQQMNLNFSFEPAIKRHYPVGDVHILFIAEIEKAFTKE